MDRETAIRQIKDSTPELLERYYPKAQAKVNGRASYICPICGHGSGGDGLTINPKGRNNSLKCFGCGFSGSIIDLYIEEANNTGGSYNFEEALAAIAGDLNIGIDIDTSQNAQKAPFNGNQKPVKGNPQEEANAPKTGQIESQKAITESGPAADYTEYYKLCRERLEDPEALTYLNGRGISTETARAYGLGYDPEADPMNYPGAMPGDPKRYPVKRIIIPVTPGYYIGRRIDGVKQYEKPGNKGGKTGIFNSAVLYAQDTHEVFITEGVFDALSILEANAPAIALNSTNNTGRLLEMLEARRTEATLIICLDNDKAGEEARQKLTEGLQRLNISFIIADICAGYKDPNEALQSNKDAFLIAIERAIVQTAAKPDNVSYYIETLMQREIKRFKQDKQTGFSYLDKQAGGLYAGLYVLAAISSLGKTSFALQLADQLAESGNDVIFFSMEQSRLELVSKSIARRTAQADITNAVNSLAIRKGRVKEESKPLLKKAIEEYKAAISDRLSIVEGNFACDLSFIGDYIRRYIKNTGTRPVIFIDYLQILQPPAASRQTTKEVIDNAVTELKRLSRELELTVFVISSVNRSNYMTAIDFESLKESGNIEFTADVIWGLQLECLSDPLFDKEGKVNEKRQKIRDAKSETPRKIELVCLKNRYGVSSYSCSFDYYPANDLFYENSPDGDADFRTAIYSPF